ncbi:hypothetical protein [Sphingobacterium multivorum]|uniref:hypothetical protein n=1 Tax=Sphingobacterium multivorum TaxID=28454 RepID=UPI0028AF2205|nr:hypothetical protein [Sphingobacterium multivorum]
MENIIQKIEDLNWPLITEEMHKHGYVVIPNLLTALQCDLLKKGIAIRRSTVKLSLWKGIDSD